jgi:hypothetical protein
MDMSIALELYYISSLNIYSDCIHTKFDLTLSEGPVEIPYLHSNILYICMYIYIYIYV